MAAKPENHVRDRIKFLLEKRGWFVKITMGNAYMDGWPDLWATHRSYGQRWIEIKRPSGSFTPAQRRDFALMSAHGAHVWVLVGDVPLDDIKLNVEIDKLRGPANWYTFL